MHTMLHVMSLFFFLWERGEQIDKGDKTVKMQRKKADKRRKKGIKGMSVTDRWLGRQRELYSLPEVSSRI